MNPDIKSVKRYAIAKVYRRDQPAMSKGRMREFYQCDIDMAGATSDPMVADSEIIRIISEVFEALEWHGRYTIKLNHRKILDGVFGVCGVPAEKTRSISFCGGQVRQDAMVGSEKGDGGGEGTRWRSRR